MVNFHGTPLGPVIMVLGLAAIVIGMMIWSFFSYHHQLKHYEEPSESKHEEKKPIYRQNARVLEKAGGAAVVLEQDASGQTLFQTACGILHDGDRRSAMERAMASLGIRDATERIYRTILDLCQ